MIQKHFPAIFFILFVVILYAHNLSRSVYGGDVGDLVTAASIMGVAHPPGYPFFTLLGFFLTQLSIFHLTQAFLVGLISVFSATVGLCIFYVLSLSLSKNKIASLLATSILAFSFLYWFYAEIAEVFALNSLFALLLFLCAFLYRQKKSPKFLFLFVFFLGLSLTNHQTIILLFPSLFLLVGGTFLQSLKQSKKNIYIVLAGFFLGLTPYIYIPFASAHHPIINWDNVRDIPSFFHLILRQDYGTFRAGVFHTPTWSQRLITLKIYIFSIISQLTIPVVVMSLLGYGVLWRKDKLFCLSVILAFIISGPFFIMYAGFPLTGSFTLGVYERFFSLSSLIFLFPFSVGIVSFVTFLSKILSRKIYMTVFQIVFFIIPITLFFYNFPKTNLSSLMLGDTYAEDLLTPLSPHALLVFNGDSIVFNTWYIHYVRNIRPDIALYNIGGEVQNISANDVLTNNPTGKSLEKKQDILVNSLIETAKTRPVFSTIILEPTADAKKITWIPYGLAYKLTLASDSLPSQKQYVSLQKKIWSSFRIPTANERKELVYHDLTITAFPTGYSSAALATGTYLYTRYADTEDSLSYYKKAIEIDPENAKAYETLGTYYIGVGGKCLDVVENLTSAIFLDPFEKIPYFLLYKTYMDCLHKTDAAHEVAQQFQSVFQENFSKDMKNQLPQGLFSQ